jgi:hypothetical protein
MLTISVWVHRLTHTESVQNHYGEAVMVSEPMEEIHVQRHAKMELTDAFWSWEAQGRLNLIDRILDDQKLTSYRQNWSRESISQEDLIKKAQYLIDVQNESYGVTTRFDAPHMAFIPLRGDANGLYVPQDKTIYLNSRMKWDDLAFERFLEVVFHENMHHIMTSMGATLGHENALHGDFTALALSAYYHDTSGMAQDQTDLYQVNPQELVAWRTQRAARYAGILGAGMDALEMTARMQELRHIRSKAGF